MTGRTGTLRLKLRNNADFPVSVRVRLGAASNKLTFPPEDAPRAGSRTTTTELKFEIKARSNGRFPVYLHAARPDDTGPNRRTRCTSRPGSPPPVYALSGLGNLVTGAALLILLSWWVHHIRSSRRRKATEAGVDGRHPVSARAAEPATSADAPGAEAGAAPPHALDGRTRQTPSLTAV